MEAYKEMYHCLAATVTKVEQLLSEAYTSACNVPQDMKNYHQIRASIFNAQVYAAITLLNQSLADAESILLDTTP